MDCGGFFHPYHLRVGILGHYRELPRGLVLRVLAVERGVDVRTVSQPDAHLYGSHAHFNFLAPVWRSSTRDRRLACCFGFLKHSPMRQRL